MWSCMLGSSCLFVSTVFPNLPNPKNGGHNIWNDHSTMILLISVDTHIRRWLFRQCSMWPLAVLLDFSWKTSAGSGTLPGSRPMPRSPSSPAVEPQVEDLRICWRWLVLVLGHPFGESICIIYYIYIILYIYIYYISGNLHIYLRVCINIYRESEMFYFWIFLLFFLSI